MQNRFPPLITSDAEAGLVLAGRLAAQLHTQLEQTDSKVELPGGMNYLLPAPVSKEITAAILFYAIAAVNHGWTDRS